MKATMVELARTRATFVWFLLVLATLLSWWLGTDGGHRENASQELASIVILLVAFIKVRFIGLYFMELRAAPRALYGIFEAYCIVVCSVVIGMFVWA